jgi:hypothetical protein
MGGTREYHKLLRFNCGGEQLFGFIKRRASVEITGRNKNGTIDRCNAVNRAQIIRGYSYAWL